MADSILELISYKFFINAVFAIFFASISCGIIGTYIVSRRIVFISGGITHASFGGIGMGYFLGINPLYGAAFFGIIAAVLIEFFSHKADIREDSAIGIMWSIGMAVGIIFISITPGYAPNLMTYLFGNILTVSQENIKIMAIVTIFIALFFKIMYRGILYTAFDEVYMRAKKAPVNFIKYTLMMLIALTIVINIRVSGVILMISMLTIPQAIASIFVNDFKKVIFLSVIAGFLTSFTGLIVSYLLNIPSGAVIILIMTTVFIISKSIKILVDKIKYEK